jgi:gas vesicle protein GvpL/GvpF
VSATSRPPGRGESGTGWYVYGVIPASEARAGLFEGVASVGDGSIVFVGTDRLAAIASEVPLDQFGEEAIGDNLRDPDWLEGRVRAHEAVLEAALRDVPVVPFRFGTIYRSRDQVREMLDHHDRLGPALDHVRGRVELGVKAFLAAAAADPEPAPEQAGVPAGRRYLEEKQRSRRTAEERDTLKAAVAQETHERLAATAVEATANPLQAPEISGRDAEMLLNGAYLVEREREAGFRNALAELERDLGPSGVLYELTGPWPPYNFVEVTE